MSLLVTLVVFVLAGPPGTGKTARLIQLVQSLLDKGVLWSAIAILSFTRTAAQEIRDRCGKTRGAGSGGRIGTVHAVALQLLQFALGHKVEIMSDDDWTTFGREHGYEFTPEGKVNLETGLPLSSRSVKTDGDKLRFVHAFSVARCIPLSQAIADTKSALSLAQLQAFHHQLADYKTTYGRLEFDDLLLEVLRLELYLDGVEELIVDEAQDVSTLQGKVIDFWASRCKTLTLAGDDDQSLYRWAGACPSWFADHCTAAGTNLKVLSQSHRVPQAQHLLATKITSEISSRVNKPYRPTKSPGQVEEASAVWATVIVQYQVLAGATVLVLGRTNKILRAFQTQLHSRNVESAFLNAVAPGGSQVLLSTFHGAKGREFSAVVLLCELSPAAAKALHDPATRDDELRVAYVGVTRSKRDLILVPGPSSSNRSYPLIEWWRELNNKAAVGQ